MIEHYPWTSVVLIVCGGPALAGLLLVGLLFALSRLGSAWHKIVMRRVMDATPGYIMVNGVPVRSEDVLKALE